jgi:lipoyl(octanoyl) transferase
MLMLKNIRNRFMSIIINQEFILYDEAVKIMQSIVENIAQHRNKDVVWLLEHHSIYTSGYMTYNSWVNRYGHFISGIPLIATERGGQITYHGPGQRICYFMMDLRRKYGEINLRKFLDDIHQVIIDVLAEFGVDGIKDPIYPGIWVKSSASMNKIAAVGIRIRKGVSYHGVALNINTELSFFHLIKPM